MSSVSQESHKAVIHMADTFNACGKLMDGNCVKNISSDIVDIISWHSSSGKHVTIRDVVRNDFDSINNTVVAVIR